jgi:dolichol-phosphate mannosyltransferase
VSRSEDIKPVSPGLISVVIPTYNEAENISALLGHILSFDLPLEVIVVDDNSPDGTAECAEALGSPRVRVLKRIGVRGYGSAVLTGFHEALRSQSRLIIGMDSDFSHDPGMIPELVREAEKADVVIGSRYCPGGGSENWPLHRRMLSWTANRYVRTILGIPVDDSTSGFRCYRREIIEGMDLDAIRSEGYSFLVEVLYRTYLEGARIREIPIRFVDRLRGKSKISPKEIYRSIYMVVWLRWALRHESGRTR